MPDGIPEPIQLVYLNAFEAAQMWRDITDEHLTHEMYVEKCVAGDLQEKGVDVRQGDGGAWLTDMDSLLAYFERETAAQMRRIGEMLEERRLELGG